MLKRLFDFVCALAGTGVLLPLFLILALWIKLDSPGPVFFRQVRIGRGGKPFRIHKFRTMRSESEREGLLTVGEDQRITHSGRFLRKYKLDELPQLIDVFAGDMSLVGPRPEVREFMDCYPEAVREKVLSVRPGITDLASIRMIDENELLARYEDPRQAYLDVILPEKQRYYVEYVDQRSFALDVRILLKTLAAIGLR